jgi:aspartate aminotransferase
VLAKSDLETIAQLVKKHRLIVISDDVYWYFNYSQEPLIHLLQLSPDLANRTFIVNSVSKSYCMTGWRLGWAIGPREAIEKMEMLQGQSASNPSSITQMAAIEALNGSQKSVRVMRDVFAERRKKLVEQMQKINEKYSDSPLPLAIPEGAFYALIDVRNRKKTSENDIDFCMALLRETGVAVTPGKVFGSACDGFVRISFAAADEVVKGGLERLGEYRV